MISALRQVENQDILAEASFYSALANSIQSICDSSARSYLNEQVKQMQEDDIGGAEWFRKLINIITTLHRQQQSQVANDRDAHYQAGRLSNALSSIATFLDKPVTISEEDVLSLEWIQNIANVAVMTASDIQNVVTTVQSVQSSASKLQRTDQEKTNP